MTERAAKCRYTENNLKLSEPLWYGIPCTYKITL